jgi:flagellar hook-basal body complex protein FliE
MKVTAIDSGRIEAMMAQLKAAAQKHSAGTIEGGIGNVGLPGAINQPSGTGKVSFADALKSSLNQVNKAQSEADTLGQRFSMGDDKVNLSDVMISMQKASISFQATVQVRNKVIAAYNDIMNMQI